MEQLKNSGINIRVLLTGIFDTMDKLFIDKYIVMNKYDEVPDKLPSDLDMCITPRDFNQLDYIMKQVSKESQLPIIQKIWHGYQKCAYIFSPLMPQSPFRLQLDFFTDFSVKNTPKLIPYQEMQTKTRKYGRFTIPDYPVEFVFLMMRRIFKNDFDFDHTNTIRDVFIQDSDSCFTYFNKYFSTEISNYVASYISENNYMALQKIQPRLLTELKKLSQKNTNFTNRLIFRWNEIKRHCFRIKYPVGMSIALLSPDGGGKSSVLEKLNTTCWGSFHGINRFYFRPHVFKNPGMLNPLNPIPESTVNPDPHGKKPNGLIKSLIRYFYYNLDFIIGYNTIILKKRIQKQLVIFDRYYYDYFVDIQRYQYSFPNWLPKLFAWTIPSPDLIFILEGDAEVLYNRKKELPIEEIERQTKEYHKIANKYDNAITIDVNKPLHEVVNKITHDILLYKAQRTAKSMNILINKKGLPE